MQNPPGPQHPEVKQTWPGPHCELAVHVVPVQISCTQAGVPSAVDTHPHISPLEAVPQNVVHPVALPVVHGAGAVHVPPKHSCPCEQQAKPVGP
jgi:hypothetical protein